MHSTPKKTADKMGIIVKTQPVTSSKWLRHLLTTFARPPQKSDVNASALNSVVFGGVAGNYLRAFRGHQATERDLELLFSFWQNRTKDEELKAVRVIWSIGQKLEIDLTNAGIPAAELLVSAALRCLSAYTFEHHPDSSFGFVVGPDSTVPGSRVVGLLFTKDENGASILPGWDAEKISASVSAKAEFTSQIQVLFVEFLTEVVLGIGRTISTPVPSAVNAFTKLCVGNFLHTSLAEKCSKEKQIDPAEAAGITLPQAYSLYSDGNAMAAAQLAGREQYRLFARLTLKPGFQAKMLEPPVNLVQKIISDSAVYRASLREMMDAVVSEFESLSQTKDRIHDRFLNPGMRQSPGGHIDTVRHLAPAVDKMTLMHSLNLLSALHEERRTRVKRHFASVIGAINNLLAVLDRPAHFSALRSSQYTYSVRRLLDIIAASKGRVPEYLTAPLDVEQANPFLDCPDQGAAYHRALLQDAADRLGCPAIQGEKLEQSIQQSIQELGGKTLDELKAALAAGEATTDLRRDDSLGEIQKIPKGQRPTEDGLQSTFSWGLPVKQLD